MDIGTILVLGGSVVLWFVGLGVSAIATTKVALGAGYDKDGADMIGGLVVLVYLALSAIGLGLHL